MTLTAAYQTGQVRARVRAGQVRGLCRRAVSADVPCAQATSLTRSTHSSASRVSNTAPSHPPPLHRAWHIMQHRAPRHCGTVSNPGSAGLSLLGYPTLKAIDPVYALPVHVMERLKIKSVYSTK